jgi:hypothetical protein
LTEGCGRKGRSGEVVVDNEEDGKMFNLLMSQDTVEGTSIIPRNFNGGRTPVASCATIMF